jgi:hypothetical protein
MALLYGALHIASENHREFNLVLAKQPRIEAMVKAESPYDLPLRESRLSKLSARVVKPARVLKHVAPDYPAVAKMVPGWKAGVQIAGVIRHKRSVRRHHRSFCSKPRSSDSDLAGSPAVALFTHLYRWPTNGSSNSYRRSFPPSLIHVVGKWR